MQQGFISSETTLNAALMCSTAQQCVTAWWHRTTSFDPVPTIQFIEWVSLLWDIPEFSYQLQTKEETLAREKSQGAFVLLWTDTEASVTGDAFPGWFQTEYKNPDHQMFLWNPKERDHQK